MGQRPTEFTPADRRDVHEQMWRNALKFQKPRSFAHSGKARAAAEGRSAKRAQYWRNVRSRSARRSALARQAVFIESRVAMNGMRRRRLRKRLASRRSTLGGMRTRRGARAGAGAAQPPLHLAAIHAAPGTRPAK